METRGPPEPAPATLVAVASTAQREAARVLVTEYLTWVAALARSAYGLQFDAEAMARSDLKDAAKFFPPTGRFYLVQQGDAFVGVGCLRQLAAGMGELQRMYVQPRARGLGAGRLLLERLLQDARALGCLRVRLESLKALAAAHSLYRSVGFVEIDPYSDNSMRDYQPACTLDNYRASAVFMELALR